MQATASSSANLAQGTLGASAYGSGFDAGGSASAEFFDTLDFHIPGATASTVTNIGLSLFLHGTTTAPADAVITEALRLALGGTGLDLSGGYVFSHELQGTGTYTVTDVANPNWGTYTLTNNGLDGLNFSGVFAVVGPNPEVTIDSTLDVAGSAQNLGPVDLAFSNTDGVSLLLPSGTTFASASGVFLTQPVTDNVPEPSSLAILVSAFLMVMGAMKTRTFVRATRRTSRDCA